MSPPWLHSKMPFFVIMCEDDLRSNSPAQIGDNEIYPEVRYVFADDDFDPTIDALEQQSPEDISIIIDMDESGQNVVGHASLSDNWQVTSVRSDSSSATSAVGDRCTSLIVKGRKSGIQIPSNLGVKDLSDLFKKRNSQLKEVMGMYEKTQE